MSRSVDLFIRSGLSLEETAGVLRERLELSLQPHPDGDRYTVTHEGVTLALRAHPYIDDGDLPFTRYPLALSAKVGDGARPQDSSEAAALRRLAQRIQQGPGWPVLLVLDLQFHDAPVAPDTAGAGGTGNAVAPSAAGTTDGATA